MALAEQVRKELDKRMRNIFLGDNGGVMPENGQPSQVRCSTGDAVTFARPKDVPVGNPVLVDVNGTLFTAFRTKDKFVCVERDTMLVDLVTLDGCVVMSMTDFVYEQYESPEVITPDRVGSDVALIEDGPRLLYGLVLGGDVCLYDRVADEFRSVNLYGCRLVGKLVPSLELEAKQR